MRKYLAMLLITALLLTGCSAPKSLTGSWLCAAPEGDILYTFTADGFMSVIDTRQDPVYQWSGRYELRGGTLAIISTNKYLSQCVPCIRTGDTMLIGGKLRFIKQ